MAGIKAVILFGVIFLIFVCLLVIYSQLEKDGQKLSSVLNSQNDQIKKNPVEFFDMEPFLQGVKEAQIKGQAQKNPTISGLIIPHHLYPSLLLSEAFQKIDPISAEWIILIGPNHYNRGNFPVLTAENNWQTDFGIISSDTETINSLKNNNYAVSDDESLIKEHSVAGIYPYIRYYLPNAKVTPLVLRKDITKDQIDQLATRIAGLITPRTIVIAAVDFSHNLLSEFAESRDLISLDAIKENNQDKLLDFNDEYMDSPESVVLLLKIMDKINAKNQQVLGHTNSGILKKDYSTPVTSYYSIGFSK